MLPAPILFYVDESGSTHVARIDKPQFTIGRSSDNDLCIPISRLSRHHATIEEIGGSFFISDPGSQNGTFVNNRTVVATVQVQNGDIINLGGGCDLTFSTEQSAQATPAIESQSSASNTGQSTENPPLPGVPATTTAEGETRSPVPLIAAIAIGVIALGAIVFIVIAISSSGSNTNRDIANLSDAESNKLPARNPTPVPSGSVERVINESRNTAIPDATPGAIAADSDEEIGRAAQRVMVRISKEGSAYISPTGIHDIAAKVRQYKGSSALATKLKAASRGCSQMTELAQSNSLKPSLLEYAAMAESDSAADPVVVAKQIAPKLLTLRATFGTDTPNSTLLLIAAYPYPFNPEIGSQTRTAHPLATKLVELGGRRSVEDTSIARSVWFLKDNNGLLPESYDLVVRMLAVGIISQDPHSFGVDADPVFC